MTALLRPLLVVALPALALIAAWIAMKWLSKPALPTDIKGANRAPFWGAAVITMLGLVCGAFGNAPDGPAEWDTRLDAIHSITWLPTLSVLDFWRSIGGEQDDSHGIEAAALHLGQWFGLMLTPALWWIVITCALRLRRRQQPTTRSE